MINPEKEKKEAIRMVKVNTSIAAAFLITFIVFAVSMFIETPKDDYYTVLSPVFLLGAIICSAITVALGRRLRDIRKGVIQPFVFIYYNYRYHIDQTFYVFAKNEAFAESKARKIYRQIFVKYWPRLIKS